MEKMSKSRGNVVWVDEVVFGVIDINDKYEFRNESGFVIKDYKKFGVWRDVHNMCKIAKGCYFTTNRCGLQPVFLCQKDNEIPPALQFENTIIIQHPQSKWWHLSIKGGYSDVKKGDDLIWSLEKAINEEKDSIRIDALLKTLKEIKENQTF